MSQRDSGTPREGNVYFSIAADPRYGELSKLSRDEMLPIANERGNVPNMPGKRDPLDFVLWQRSLPDEPSWSSPWGPGRPGWHIECSAMASAYLGTRFEIHGGGGDLLFPHHESELAQAEGASGERPWVAHWTHAGMLSYEGAKMSKSLGNLVLVRDLLRTYPGDAIRHYLVARHYRSEVDFVEGDLAHAADAAALLRRASRARRGACPRRAWPSPMPMPSTRVSRSTANDSSRRLDDDLDTPRAMPELVALAMLALESDDPSLAAQAGWMVRELGARILGLRLGTVPALRATAAA